MIAAMLAGAVVALVAFWVGSECTYRNIQRRLDEWDAIATREGEE